MKKQYVIEYIDNERDLDLLDAGTHPAPWELYKRETITEEVSHNGYVGSKSIDGEAWKKFILWSLCPDQIYLYKGDRVTHPLYCQMWMELLDDDGVVVYEDFCELPSTIKHTLFSAINREVNNQRDNALKYADSLQEELDTYKSFIKHYNSEKLFDDFRREMSK